MPTSIAAPLNNALFYPEEGRVPKAGALFSASPEPQSKQQTGELALALGRFFSLELIAAVIRTAQEMGLGGFSSLQQWSGKSQILSEPQALFLAKDLSEHRNVFFLKGKQPVFQLCV